MNENRRSGSILNKWEADWEDYENGARMQVSYPQCTTCTNCIVGNALHCKRYENEEKPSYVMFPQKECPAYHNDSPIQLEVRDDRESKLYGGLFGFCAGDALGVPVEFTTRSERKEDPVMEMRAYGTYHQPFGTWSDDTSLTLCLIDALNGDAPDGGSWMERTVQNFVSFYEKAAFTPHDEVFDMGAATGNAIVNMRAGKNPTECGGRTERDNGNGSLMRILPVVFYARNMDAQERMKLTEDISSLTHGHNRSKLACILYVEFAVWLLAGDDKEKALEHAVTFIDSNCTHRYKDDIPYYGRILGKDIMNIDEDAISSSGYVVDTLEAVMWAFFHADSYRETVLKAVNLGGDTDTIAAIAGGLAGIYYGVKDIPDAWIQNLAKKEELYKMFKQFGTQTGMVKGK